MRLGISKVFNLRKRPLIGWRRTTATAPIIPAVSAPIIAVNASFDQRAAHEARRVANKIERDARRVSRKSEHAARKAAHDARRAARKAAHDARIAARNAAGAALPVTLPTVPSTALPPAASSPMFQSTLPDYNGDADYSDSEYTDEADLPAITSGPSPTESLFNQYNPDDFSELNTGNSDSEYSDDGDYLYGLNAAPAPKTGGISGTGALVIGAALYFMWKNRKG
jgi:hypothetical protein